MCAEVIKHRNALQFGGTKSNLCARLFFKYDELKTCLIQLGPSTLDADELPFLWLQTIHHMCSACRHSVACYQHTADLRRHTHCVGQRHCAVFTTQHMTQVPCCLGGVSDSIGAAPSPRGRPAAVTAPGRP